MNSSESSDGSSANGGNNPSGTQKKEALGNRDFGQEQELYRRGRGQGERVESYIGTDERELREPEREDRTKTPAQATVVRGYVPLTTHRAHGEGDSPTAGGTVPPPHRVVNPNAHAGGGPTGAAGRTRSASRMETTPLPPPPPPPPPPPIEDTVPRPSNLIDVMFESLMTSGADEKYIVRQFSSAIYVTPNGEPEDFNQYDQMAQVPIALTGSVYDDHFNIRGCMRFGQTQEDNVYNFCCFDLQILMEKNQPILTQRPNTTPQEFLRSFVGTRARPNPVDIPAFAEDEVLFGPLESLELGDGDHSLSVANRVLFQIVHLLVHEIAGNDPNLHIVGVNHGPITIGKVRREIRAEGQPDLVSWD